MTTVSARRLQRFLITAAALAAAACGSAAVSASAPAGGGISGSGAPDAGPTIPSGPLAAMGLAASSLPPSPTNFAADLPAAAALGQRIFGDVRMSSDGRVACASCHDATRGFSDPRPVSVGVAGRTGSRHAPSVVTVALTPFLFWDGRADSPWSQPLKAIEGAAEMDFSRTEVAALVLNRYRADYEAIFGGVPDLGALPARAMPGLAAWDGMTAGQRDGVERIFANVGKALEAYERKLSCADTRFDRWTRGRVAFTAAETAGARQFVSGRCIACHTGAAFSDGGFHDLGLSPATAAPDSGRIAAHALLQADPFNGAGEYSDDPMSGQRRLDSLAAETGTLGAFRTASLRGVGQRPRFGHAGRFNDLTAFLRDTYDRPRLHAGTVGVLDPKLAGVDLGDTAELVSFLRTLDCPPVAAGLLP